MELGPVGIKNELLRNGGAPLEYSLRPRFLTGLRRVNSGPVRNLVDSLRDNFHLE